MMDILIGLVLASIISGFAYYRQSLNRSGAIAALIVGTIIYASGGVLMMAVLLTFFVSSNLIGRVFTIPKEPANRTATQVLANGLVATILAVLFYLTGEDRYFMLFLISIAVATADTWSSELGVLSPSKPVSLVTLKPVDVGVSGAVTKVGLLASLGGAILISSFLMFNLYVIVFGVLGSVLDSVLGHFQVRFVDESTGQIREDHHRHPSDRYHSGIRFLTNDSVNFFSNAVTVLLATLIL